MTSVLQQGKMEESCSGLETTGKGSTHELASSSEDSSYDSDYCCEISEESNPHNDVSRTVSDTLAQEFNEYVTCSDKPNMGVQGFDTNYVAKVDFARKLGYTEDQVKRALRKLGPLATQNELLAELIQIDVEGGSSQSGSASPSIRLGSVETKLEDKLRHIIIDGSNVAMSHGSNKVFSSHGIRIAVDYFRARGHKEITVFLPMFRKETIPDDPVTDPKILKDLESEGVLVWTPSKIINNKRMVCYDDRYVLKLAAETDGIVVSNDNYRDLASESPDFKKVVEERTLMYSFVNDRFMPPEDPLGRHGPTLEQFLQCNTTARTAKKIPCPYGHKCTFGSKCKYFHSTKKISVSEQLRKQAAMKTTSLPILSQERVVKQACIRTKSAVLDSAVKQPLSVYQAQETVPGAKHQLKYRNSYGCPPTTAFESTAPTSINGHRKLQRQPSVNPNLLPQEASRKAPEEPRSQLFQNLSAIFPPDRVRHVMTLYPEEKDPQVICRHILEIFK